MNRLIHILVLTLLLLPIEVWAQTKLLTGKVTEKVAGQVQPSIGVNVVIVNKQNRFITGVTTNLEGNYSIVIPDEQDLSIQFSFIGMKTQTVKYTGQKSIDILMLEDNKMLDEVTIVQKRIERNDMGISDKEQTSATQRVKMDDIMETSPVTSIEEALQGQLGGVDIISGGDPGAKSSIRIRGTNSLNTSSEPLIVIDGVPYSVDITDDFSFATANEEDYGQLLNIAPTDIESIEVLKDAAATAVWGTQGANGVLLIKTKRGSQGKTRFNFSTKFTAKVEPNSIPMLNGDEYVALMQDAIWNAANAKGLSYSADLLKLLFDTPEINYNPDWRYFDEYNQNTNWLDEVSKTAFTTDNNFAMSGGGEKATYRFSLGYMNEGGTTIGTNVNRLSSALNVNYNFSSRLRVDADFSFAQTEREANWGNVRSEALRKMPNKSPYWIDDETGEATNEYFTRQDKDEFQQEFNGKEGDKAKNFHPLAMAKDAYNDTKQRESKITFRLNYNILPELTYTGWVSMNIKSVRNQKFIPQAATGVLMSNDYANRSTDASTDNFSLQTENKLMFHKNWHEMHNLIATGLLRTRQTESSSYTSTIAGAASPNLADPTTGGRVVDKGSGRSEVRSMSGILSLHYTLLNRYMLSGTINMEGNSSMGRSNRWGYFPSVGLGWLLHEENFLKDKEWLEIAKIRLSWGQSGNTPSGSAPYIGTFKSIGQYGQYSAIAPQSVQLNNLKWETSAEYNIGVDLNFLKGKINFTFDYYNKLTKDLLQKDAKIPTSTGVKDSKIKYLNSGEMRNKGLEFRIDYEIFKNKDWRFAISANISRNVNEIEKLPSNLTQEEYSFGNGKYASRLETGTPVGSFFGYKYKGVYQNTDQTYARDARGNIMHSAGGQPLVIKNGNQNVFPGDAIYEDINNDGVIDQYDIVYIGNGMPVLTGGGSLNIKYKTWTLRASLHGRFGQKVINQARMDSEAMYNRDNQSKATLRRWRSEGDDTDIPRALFNYGYNYLGSDRFVEKASYLRLKDISLNYAIPKAVCQKWGINNLNVFITGYDLFTWTKYTGQDPEVSLPSKATDLVKDNANTPRARRFAAGISINF